MFNDDVPPLERLYTGERVGLLVLGRAQIADLTPEVPYIVISVTDPDRTDASVLPTPSCAVPSTWLSPSRLCCFCCPSSSLSPSSSASTVPAPSSLSKRASPSTVTFFPSSSSAPCS